MHHMIITTEKVTDILYLSMAVMTRCNNIRCPGGRDLIKFYPSKSLSVVRKSGLKRPAAAAAAEIVCTVRDRFDKVFFTNGCL